MGKPGNIDDIRPFAELAQNATTAVYKAYQGSLERFVLLKRLRPVVSRDEDLALRFQEEARIAARIQHPNVVSIFTFGSDDESAYIVAEFVDGFDLSELIARSRIPPDIALYILAEAARGLKAAHDKGILHRDLKPSNILVSRSGEVKISDFGMASVTGSAHGSPSEIRGTLAYLPPEQILESEVDVRSDLFSLGATFFEMLTGRRAFPGSGPSEIFDAILNRSPLPYLSATRGVDDRIRQICDRVLARDPAARYPNAGAMILALESCARERGARIDADSVSVFLEEPSSFVASDMPPKKAAPVETGVTDGYKPVANGRVPERRWSGAASAYLVLVVMVALAYAGFFLVLPGANSGASTDATAEDAAGLRWPDTTAFLTGSQDRFWSTYGLVDSSALVSVSAREETPAPGTPAADDEYPRDSSTMATPGFLSVYVEPSAAVFIGTDAVGTASVDTPLTLPLAPGVHDISVRNSEFPLETRSVDVQPDDTTLVDISLWATVGRLALQVSPWANVYVDGRHVGQTPLAEPLILRPGEREIRLVNPEMGVDFTTTVTIPRGETVSRDVILSDQH